MNDSTAPGYLLDVERGETTWTLEVSKAMSNPLGSLYGGAPVAVSIEMAEHVVGAPCRWSTTRFLSPSNIGDRIDVDCRVDVAGKRTSQATVTGTRDGNVIFETMLGVGEGKADGLRGRWVTMPDAPDPESLNRPDAENQPPWVMETAVVRAERRMAYGHFPGLGPAQEDGRIGMWARTSDIGGCTSAALGWLADCVPMSIGAAIGKMPMGMSLDNTVRFASEPPADTDWILLDIRAGAVEHGYGYGTVHIWTQDGTLLATGTQTAIIRSP
ncbi:MAG: thioesterase family protein [Acidimicrobiales bacterium]|nr:thioesterase family protein [Acidimicrobiales bacterium]